jgi:hypothetical protein
MGCLSDAIGAGYNTIEAGLSKIDHALPAARLKPRPPKTASQNLPNSILAATQMPAYQE